MPVNIGGWGVGGGQNTWKTGHRDPKLAMKPGLKRVFCTMELLSQGLALAEYLNQSENPS